MHLPSRAREMGRCSRSGGLAAGRPVRLNDWRPIGRQRFRCQRAECVLYKSIFCRPLARFSSDDKQSATAAASSAMLMAGRSREHRPQQRTNSHIDYTHAQREHSSSRELLQARKSSQASERALVFVAGVYYYATATVSEFGACCMCSAPAELTLVAIAQLKSTRPRAN